MGMGGQRHTPATLPPRKNRYPLFRSNTAKLNSTSNLSRLTNIRINDFTGYKLDTQYTYNVKLRYDRVTLFALEKQ
jgi:hypothetical protein